MQMGGGKPFESQTRNGVGVEERGRGMSLSSKLTEGIPLSGMTPLRLALADNRTKGKRG